MAIRPDYDIGTVTLSSGSSDFTTSGSSLLTAAVQAGDAIIAPSGHVLIIASITGQNSGTLFLPCPAAAAGTGLPLHIRFQPDGSRYQGAVRNMIDLLSSGNIEAFAALVGSAGLVPIFTGVGTMDLADPATFGIQDPNGSLGKLAALTLAANKILNTDGSGNLTQSDITAAAVALMNLSGTAATDRMPYFTGENGAGLTALTSFARTILDDASGAAMWATMGANEARFANGYVKLPAGLIIQWGNATLNASGVWVPYPTGFPNVAFRTIVGCANGSVLTNCGWGTPADKNGFTGFSSSLAGIHYIAVGW